MVFQAGGLRHEKISIAFKTARCISLALLLAASTAYAQTHNDTRLTRHNYNPYGFGANQNYNPYGYQAPTPPPTTIVIPPRNPTGQLTEGMIIDNNTGRIIMYQHIGNDTFVTTY